jgi:hypothetical protein
MDEWQVYHILGITGETSNQTPKERELTFGNSWRIAINFSYAGYDEANDWGNHELK